MTLVQLDIYTRRGRCSSLLVHLGFQDRRCQNAFHALRPFPSTVQGPHMVKPSSPSALISAAKYWHVSPSMRVSQTL